MCVAASSYSNSQTWATETGKKVKMQWNACSFIYSVLLCHWHFSADPWGILNIYFAPLIFFFPPVCPAWSGSWSHKWSLIPIHLVAVGHRTAVFPCTLFSAHRQGPSLTLSHIPGPLHSEWGRAGVLPVLRLCAGHLPWSWGEETPVCGQRTTVPLCRMQSLPQVWKYGVS